MPKPDLLVDTHILLWWKAGSKRLPKSVLDAIRTPEGPQVSPITFWEVATLVRKGRLALDRAPTRWSIDVLADPDEPLRVAPLSPAVAAAAGAFETVHGDPADRLILATAQTHGLTLATSDSTLADAAASMGISVLG
ncbi:MAG: type II toxin-antitoxin system VapC family toxin [Microthrixaceae bacterium]